MNKIKIGIVKEQVKDEKRVILLPTQIKELTKKGFSVMVEIDAGIECGYTNSDYIKSGALILDKETIWRDADVIIKYKAPIQEEYRFFRPNLKICALFHAEGDENLIKQMLKKKITAFSFEFLKTKDNFFPLAKAGGEIAGKFAVIMGAYLLQKQFGGKGKLLTYIRDSTKAVVGVIGYGNVGAAAIKLASDMGNKVICFGTNLPKMNKFSLSYDDNVTFVESTTKNFEKYLPQIDLLIGAIQISTYNTPPLINEQLIKKMVKGSVIIDVTCGYGSGYLPFIKKNTTLSQPYYTEDGLIYCKIDNLPSAFPMTTVEAYSKNAFPYICKILNSIESGHKDELVETCKIVENGQITHEVLKQHMEFYGNKL